LIRSISQAALLELDRFYPSTDPHIDGPTQMANGWAPDGAVQDQIDDSIKDAVLSARARLTAGPSATQCDECDGPIPTARQEAIAGVRTCVTCQSQLDRQRTFSIINRRGSKDSQLR
jgi:phage/conjugal plasmid C-4 type zinc finger TraR family protein